MLQNINYLTKDAQKTVNNLIQKSIDGTITNHQREKLNDLLEKADLLAGKTAFEKDYDKEAKSKAKQPAKAKSKAKQPAKAKSKAKQPAKAKSNGVEIINYSDKSIAVIGDTKPIKETLKANKGRFNMFLNIKGEKVPGWIFSAKNEQTMREVLKDLL